MKDELIELKAFLEGQVQAYDKEMIELEGKVCGTQDALTKISILLNRRKASDETKDIEDGKKGLIK